MISILDNKIPKKDLDFLNKTLRKLNKNMVNTAGKDVWMIVTFLASLGFNATISNKKMLRENIKEHIADINLHKRQIKCALMRANIENSPFEFPTRIYKMQVDKKYDELIKDLKDVYRKEKDDGVEA